MADVTINGKQVSTLTMNGNIVYSRYFKPLEYIESSGTQCIDLNAIIQSTRELTIKFQIFPKQETTANASIAGCGSGTKANYIMSLDSSNANFRFCFGATSATAGKCFTKTADESVHTLIYNQYSTRKVILDGTELGTFTYTTNASETVSLFGLHQSSAYNYKTATGRIYYCTLKDPTGDIIRNMIPCKLTSYVPANRVQRGTRCAYAGEIGMWETCDNKFYPNVGTGTFIEPPDIPATIKNYIQSSGTQYIDTKLKMSPTTKMVADVQLTALDTTWSIPFGADTKSGGEPMFWGMKTTLTYIQCGDGISLASSGNTNRHSIIIDAVSKTYKYDSTSGSFTSGITQTGELNTYLFAFNRAAVMFNASAKIYSFKMYSGGTLVGNFVPCQLNSAITAAEDSAGTARASGTIGMWDTVSNKFFANAGTGTFTAG